MTLIKIEHEEADPLDYIEGSGWYLLTELYGQIAVIGIGHRALRIGSSTESHIRVRNSDLLVKHAVFSKADPHVVITNSEVAPVYVNGRRNRNSSLADRDVVRVGELEFVVVHKS